MSLWLFAGLTGGRLGTGAALVQWPPLFSAMDDIAIWCPRGLAFTPPVGATVHMDPPEVFADLRILATSDVHMHITGWDALRDCDVSGRGMDVLGHKIDAARRSAPGTCLLLDNGDALQGTPIGDVFAELPGEITHPWAAILNAMGYDAVGLGNHDFDFGVPFLEQVVAQVRTPTLCASFKRGGVAGVVPIVLLGRNMLCSDGKTRNLGVGVTSVLPPQTVIWNHRHLGDKLEFHPGVAAAHRAVSELQAQGADIIVVLCHSGLTGSHKGDCENFGATLAGEVAGIDALVLGHTHRHFPTRNGPHDLHGVPAVLPGYGADVFGQIDLRLSWTKAGWHVVRHSASLHAPAETDAPKAELAAIAAPALDRARHELDRVVGHTKTGFHSYFGMLGSGPCAAVVARAMMHTVASHIAGTDLAQLPLIASVAHMAMGGRGGPNNFVDVPAGAIRARHVSMLTPYPNAIWAVTLSGADLFLWAERASAFFAKPDGDAGPLVNPDAPSFNFDMLHGLETVIDPFGAPMFDPLGRCVGPSAGRVRALTFNGAPVDPDAAFLVAMTSYRAAGGGAFPALGRDKRTLKTDTDVSTALRALLERDDLTFDPAQTVWRFAPGNDARVTIETSPGARAHLDDIAGFDPQVIGETVDGFLRVGVTI